MSVVFNSFEVIEIDGIVAGNIVDVISNHASRRTEVLTAFGVYCEQVKTQNDAKLSEQVATLTTEKATLTEQLATANATIATLQVQVANCNIIDHSTHDGQRQTFHKSIHREGSERILLV